MWVAAAVSGGWECGANAAQSTKTPLALVTLWQNTELHNVCGCRSTWKPYWELTYQHDSTGSRAWKSNTWWRHQMEIFPRYWPLVRGLHRPPVNSPHKGQWRRALMYILICAWINRWVNNREASDLRRHLAHYDVILMNIPYFFANVITYDIKYQRWGI